MTKNSAGIFWIFLAYSLPDLGHMHPLLNINLSSTPWPQIHIWSFYCLYNFSITWSQAKFQAWESIKINLFAMFQITNLIVFNLIFSMVLFLLRFQSIFSALFLKLSIWLCLSLSLHILLFNVIFKLSDPISLNETPVV